MKTTLKFYFNEEYEPQSLTNAKEKLTKFLTTLSSDETEQVTRHDENSIQFNKKVNEGQIALIAKKLKPAEVAIISLQEKEDGEEKNACLNVYHYINGVQMNVKMGNMNVSSEDGDYEEETKSALEYIETKIQNIFQDNRKQNLMVASVAELVRSLNYDLEDQLIIERMRTYEEYATVGIAAGNNLFYVKATGEEDNSKNITSFCSALAEAEPDSSECPTLITAHNINLAPADTNLLEHQERLNVFAEYNPGFFKKSQENEEVTVSWEN